MIESYKNVVGTPSSIEMSVNELLQTGEWTINGTLLPYTPENRQSGLYVQSMVKIEKNLRGDRLPGYAYA